MLIITSNYPEKLDEALVRPGRIDMIIEFKKANKGVIRDMYECFFEHLPDEEKVEQIDDYKWSPAEVSQIMFKNCHTPKEALNDLIQKDPASYFQFSYFESEAEKKKQEALKLEAPNSTTSKSNSKSTNSKSTPKSTKSPKIPKMDKNVPSFNFKFTPPNNPIIIPQNDGLDNTLQIQSNSIEEIVKANKSNFPPSDEEDDDLESQVEEATEIAVDHGPKTVKINQISSSSEIADENFIQIIFSPIPIMNPSLVNPYKISRGELDISMDSIIKKKWPQKQIMNIMEQMANQNFRDQLDGYRLLDILAAANPAKFSYERYFSTDPPSLDN
jgi:SpoVK/Ycf46/Vps4 family AAA+-type ATPase